MNLADVTPLVLTRDEEANIARTLAALAWASEIVVVDSGSADATPHIVQTFSNVRLMQRPIDTIAEQWNFGMAAVRTPWALALDADHVVSADLAKEIERLDPRDQTAAYVARFDYAVNGRRLRASLYPAREVLLRRDRSIFWQDGHTQRVRVNGQTGMLDSRITHDDRKPFTRFIERQRHYMRQEADKLRNAAPGSLNLPSRIRKLVIIAPFAVVVHTLLVRGLILDGSAGLRYTWERFVAELMLSRELLRRRPASRSSDRP